MPSQSATAGHALSRGESPAPRPVRGRPLAGAVAEYRRAPSPLGLHDLLRPFVAACYEIAYAHSRGVTHLGLTPRLILLGDYGETAVIGWDRAAVPTNGEPAGDGAFAAGFLAPEQADGRADAVGPASDVYALGAVLYFLLSGRPPHEGATAAEVLARVREGLPWQPRMVAGGVPAALEAVCLTAMEREPRERYPSAVDLAREVERWMAGQRVRTNYVEPKAARLARWARGRYGLLVLTALAVVGLLETAVLGYAAYVLRKDRLAARAQEQRLIEVIEQKGAEARAYVEAVNRQRAFAGEEEAAAIHVLQALALAAQPRPNDPNAAYKAEQLRALLNAARQLALRADVSGGTDPAAAQERVSLGELFAALGQPAEARRHFERAVALARPAARAHPDNLLAQRGLAQAARGLGRLCLHEGQPALAANRAHEARAAAEAWVRLEPNNVLAKQEEAADLGLLAEAAAASHDLAAAREALEKMVAVVQGYAKPDSPNPQDRQALAGVYLNRAKLERFDHRDRDALPWYDAALGLLRPLKAEGRLAPQGLAVLDQLEKEADECRLLVKATDDISVALGEPREKALRLLGGRAAALARLGRVADAAATAEKMRELAPQDVSALYDIACCYALCASAVGAGKPADALSAEERAARADYAARGLKDLRAAVDHGYRDVAHVEADPDLDALHAEPGYRALVAELKAVRDWLTFPVLP